jgi:proteasome lid subunit RPN8/RPN11
LGRGEVKFSAAALTDDMQTLLLDEKIAQEIRAHGAETYPHECCGAMLGSDGDATREVRALHRLVNRRTDSAHNRFAVTAGDVRDAERAAKSAGLEVIGWYHSHPDHPARPSEFDREHAWPWYSYVIVSVMKGVPGVMASWRLDDDRARYSAEPIAAGAGAGQAESATQGK